MPVTYTLDPEQKLVRTQCIGNVTLYEVLIHLRDFQRDPNLPAMVDVFLDLSQNTSLPTGFEIVAIADQLKKVRQSVRFNACAIVAQRDALYGMLRMFQVMAEPHFHAIRVFRASSEAENWLASERLIT